MVVNPLIDGMNLVAQEFVASNVDATGTLVLSDQAGAHDRLGSHAVSIDQPPSMTLPPESKRPFRCPPRSASVD